MANHRSALKRWRQNEKRRARNRYWKSTMRTVVKQVYQAVENNDLDAAKANLKNAISTIDHVASKGVIHKRTASRRVSRLSKFVNKASQD